MVCEGSEKSLSLFFFVRERERERESIFMSTIWIWLSQGSKFITPSEKCIQAFITRSHGKHHECEVRRMNPKLGQRQASDARRKNLMGKRPGSNSLVRKLLFLIYKGCAYWCGKNSQRKINITRIQTVYPNHIAFCGVKQEAHSIKIGALTQKIEKSVIKLKHKPKLVKCKNSVNIPTFNVMTLNKANQLPELIAFAAEHNIDICIQENWYSHRVWEKNIMILIKDGYFCIWWKNSVNTVIESVGMLLSPYAWKSLNSIEKIQLRMMCVSYNGNPSTTIVSFYILTKGNN